MDQMQIGRGIKRSSDRSGRAYWACQILGWGGYGLAYYLAVLTPFHVAGPRQAVADLAYCLAGMLGTHLLRWLMRKRGWAERPFSALIPRLLAGALLIGLLQVAVLYGCLMLEGQFDWNREANWIAVVSTTVFFGAFLVGLWLAIYLVVQAARRRRIAELDTLRAQILAREATLRSLQQQLNPHFLFNCLNSLRGMIDEDRSRAREMVTRLAELLRASLRQDDCSAIPLEEELATVNAYLELESVRLEERLHIRREIGPGVNAALVPPMFLLGLVENALKHGITQLPSGGELVLGIAREGDLIRFEVDNSGTLGNPSGNGIGLANTRERLHLLYGRRAS
jgi:two-component system sensor histidine kinase AlgZ